MTLQESLVNKMECVLDYEMKRWGWRCMLYLS